MSFSWFDFSCVKQPLPRTRHEGPGKRSQKCSLCSRPCPANPCSDRGKLYGGHESRMSRIFQIEAISVLLSGLGSSLTCVA
ncbi:hypothetical protein I79_000714 [Cricetulus griseus]|uniref:Uncharacterized protein n=1 Tax=Cricetulus griseus TaxID=10029 RepID=G3GSU3_CRIGR|nr:hypothetical protein I79_000714 [Cricetulus griseus]